MATYKSNQAQFARFMLDDRFSNVCADVAEGIAERARDFAPKAGIDRYGRERTGDYASRFRVDTGLDLRRHDRRAAFVVNDARQAAALEAGSYNIKNPPRPLTRALNASVR